MKKVAFICYANACRSQIAEGLSKVLGAGLYKAYSAGIAPLGMVANGVYEIMARRGIDISDQYSKGLEEIPIAEMDYIIGMASFPLERIIPYYYNGETIQWEIPDPYGEGVQAYEMVADIIEANIKKFIEKTSWNRDLACP